MLNIRHGIVAGIFCASLTAIARAADAEKLFAQGIAYQAYQDKQDPDFARAKSLLEQAAAAGSTRAMVQWMIKAADAGNADARKWLTQQGKK